MEALRCNTVVPMTIPHTALRDTILKGYLLPKVTKIRQVLSTFSSNKMFVKGSIVMVNLDTVLNDKDYWKDPENFRPERHLNEDGTRVVRSDHFYPFGAGLWKS